MSRRGAKDRPLSEEERTLWRDVARSVVPLRQGSLQEDETVSAPLDAPPRRTLARRKPLTGAESAPPKRKAPPPALAPLGRREKQRLARGRDTIDGRLDLHGLTQAEAHDVLLRFLRTAQARSARLVVVITGKGSRGEEGGVLKRQVPLWLRLPEFRDMVIGFDMAHRAHGGEGALYVRVRRRRENL